MSDSAFSVQHSDFYNLTVFKNYHHDPFRVGITAPRLEDLPLMAHLGGEIVLRRSLRSDLRLLLKTEIKSLLLCYLMITFEVINIV